MPKYKTEKKIQLTLIPCKIRGISSVLCIIHALQLLYKYKEKRQDPRIIPKQLLTENNS